jgi:hypothetical protein
MVAWGPSRWSFAMTGDPTASLKWSALAFAVLWSGGMLWWNGSLELANIVILAICGGVVGACWFVAMRFIFEGAGLLPRAAAASASRGKLYPWMVWTVLMSMTGIATACLLDLINPLLPPGAAHWLISSLFVVTVWPALMWSLRPLMKRHLPA